MSMVKHASFRVLSALMGAVPEQRGLRKTADRWTPEYQPKPGYLYVRSRAISSRTNDNFDTFPAEEIKKAYRTFVGKPVFVNHHNADHRRARGVILDAYLHEDTAPDGSPDTWVEVLMEVDAITFPKLAEAILKGRIDRTSMGTNVEISECSVCGNRATDITEFCDHIRRFKGKRVTRTNPDTGERESVLCHEICYGLGFFENSLLVEDPADPTAVAWIDSDHTGMKVAASKTASQAWKKVDRGYISGDVFLERAPGNQWNVYEGVSLDEDGAVDYSYPDNCVEEGLRSLSEAKAAAEGLHRQAAKDPRFKGVSVDQDDDGYYVKTHRARSKSYPSEDAIPDSVVAEIERTGAKRVSSFEQDLDWRWVETSRGEKVGIEVHHPEGRPDPWVSGKLQPIGELRWSPDGEIVRAVVDERFRRRGLATELLRRARQERPEIHHSTALSDDGRAWAEKVGSRGPMARWEDAVAPAFPKMTVANLRAFIHRVLHSEGYEDPAGVEVFADMSLVGVGSVTRFKPEGVTKYAPELARTPEIGFAPEQMNTLTALHEVAHVIQGGYPYGVNAFTEDAHGPRWQAIYTDLLSKYAPEVGKPHVASLEKTAADLMVDQGLYYRVHHLQRAFSVDDAWSAPLRLTFTDDDEPRQGYSCYPTPWEVWGYIALQGWTNRTARDEVLIFSGEEVGTGVDGEPLVIPDHRVERFISWRDFLWELSRMTGRFASGSMTGPRGSVSFFNIASTALEEDPTDPVAQRIMQDAMPPPLRGHTAPGFGMLPMVASLGGITYRVVTPAEEPWILADRTMIVAEFEGERIGFLIWDERHGVPMIEEVWVEDTLRRRGIASAMLAKAREIDPDIVHSPHLTGDGKAWMNAVGVRTASRRASDLPVVGPMRDTYWVSGGCGALALAFVTLFPELKIAVEWGTGHDEGLVWHAVAYDPSTKRSYDYQGTSTVDMEMGNFGGKVEMDVAPQRVADAMDVLRGWTPSEPWMNDTVHEAAMVIESHWRIGEDFWTTGSRTASSRSFFHGTSVPLGPGDIIAPADPSATWEAGQAPRGPSSRWNDPSVAYATSSETSAWHWAEHSYNAGRGDRPRVFVVEPLGEVFPDPNNEFEGDVVSPAGFRVVRESTGGDYEFWKDASLRRQASDYWMSHRPGSDGPPLHDLLQGEDAPRDIYENPHYYTGGYGGASQEAIRVIRDVRGKPDAMVTIYRSLPPNVPQQINPGDWISLSRSYAEMHGMDRGWEEWVEPKSPGTYEIGEGWVQHDGSWPVISRQVPAWQVRWDVNDLVEMGWFPNSPRTASAGRVLRGVPLWIDREADARTVLAGGPAAVGTLLRLLTDLGGGLGVWWTSDAGEAYSHAEVTSGDYDLTIEGAVAAADRGEGFYGAETPVLLTANAPTVWEDDDWRVAEGSDIDLVSVKYSTNPMDDTAWIEVPVGRRLTAGAAGTEKVAALPTGITFRVDNYEPVIPRVRAEIDGVLVGTLSWWSQTGQVFNVWVATGYRRKGIASAMWDEAKKHQPNLHHSDDLSDDGRAWAERVGSLSIEAALERTAAPDRPFLDSLVYEVFRGRVLVFLTQQARDNYMAGRRTTEDSPIGRLEVEPDDGWVDKVWVAAPYRRRGLATEMVLRHLAAGYPVLHSSNTTPDGRAWQEFVMKTHNTPSREPRPWQAVAATGGSPYLPSDILSEEGRAWRETVASSLSLEDYISVAEEAVERTHWKAGSTFTLPDKSQFPKAYENDDYWAAMQPVQDLVVDILAGAGKNMHNGFKVTGDGWHVTQMGVQGATDGANWMDLRSPATLLTILHECAHIIRGTSEGQGHDKGFVDVMASLLATHVSPAAADQFKNLVGFHEDLRTATQRVGSVPGLAFEHEESRTGGSKWPVQHDLVAMLDGVEVGRLTYLTGTRANSKVLIDSLYVDDRFRRRGIGSALMDEMQRRRPGASIDHGDRTDDGKAWWSGYTRGRSVTRGRTMATLGGLTFTHHPGHIFGEDGALKPADYGIQIDTMLAKDSSGVVGGMSWYSGDFMSGGVDALWVRPDRRRQGVATALLAEVRKIVPDLDPYRTPWITDDGSAFLSAVGSLKTASMMMRYVHEPSRSEYGGIVVTDPRMVAYDGEREVGSLDWDARDPRLFGTVKVDPAYRGRGIATRLYEEAKKVNPDLDPETSVFFTPAGRGWVDSLTKTAMPDDQGWWYHFGTGMDRYLEGQYVHLGTRKAAEERMENTRSSGRGGSMLRAKISPRNPLGSPSSPMTDDEVNILTTWEGDIQSSGEMPSPDNGGDQIPWFYKNVSRETPMDIAARWGYQGAWRHDAFFYRNKVEDKGSVSVAVDPDVITARDDAPPPNPFGNDQLLLWGSKTATHDVQGDIYLMTDNPALMDLVLDLSEREFIEVFLWEQDGLVHCRIDAENFSVLTRWAEDKVFVGAHTPDEQTISELDDLRESLGLADSLARESGPDEEN